MQVQLDEEEAATLEDVEVAVDEARTGTQETDLGDGFIFLCSSLLREMIQIDAYF